MTEHPIRTLVILLVAAALLAPSAADARRRKRRRPPPSPCLVATAQMARSCSLESLESFHARLAMCVNLSDRDERAACGEEAEEGYREAVAECQAQTVARRELCRVPGFAQAYDPEIDPASFVDGIDNPYAPFRIGSRWVYEKEGEEGLEHIEIEVLPETREIEGVECTTVRDRVWLDGELVEDTLDWVAQDTEGNVWYFGEIAQNFEDGLLVDLEGSWEAGRDGAKPGFWVKAAPQEGEVYRQEFLLGEAEDVVEVLSLDAVVPVPFANGSPVLQTRDTTALEPGVEEYKFYVPGVGVVLEVDPETGEQLELIEYTP